MKTRKLYASLIGINDYQAVNKLNGCVKDILNIDALLRGIVKNQATTFQYEPCYFLAPNEGDTSIKDYEKKSKIKIKNNVPSFKNISSLAFNHLAQAKDKDICLLYYSGHGSTMRSAPAFANSKGHPQNETLVCVDSRTNSTRDLIDVELAFLLATAMKNKPDVHCLVIMDCCHSADNMRSLDMIEEESPYKNRQAEASPWVPKKEDYLGYKEGFFKIVNGRATYESTSYVQLSACRDNEQSKDTNKGGLFSINLCSLLQQRGTNISYRSIESSLAATVATANEYQNPVAEAYSNNNAYQSDLDLAFLGGGLLPYQELFEVRYVIGKDYWELKAGAINGITKPIGAQYTTVQIEGTAVIAKVTEVSSITSKLDHTHLGGLDISKHYQARIKSLGIKKLSLGFSKRIQLKPDLVTALTKSYKDDLYFINILDPKSSEMPDFMINYYESKGELKYILTPLEERLPLFKGDSKPESFLACANSVAKWYYIKSINNPTTRFKASDFIFKLEKIEGKKFTSYDELNSAEGIASEAAPNSQIDLAYVDSKNPYYRFSISIHPKSNLTQCYIQAIYLDARYGILTDRIDKARPLLTNENDAKIEVKQLDRGTYYNTLSLIVEKEFLDNGINEIFEYLRIIVSTNPAVNIDSFKQESLQIDTEAKMDMELMSSKGEGTLIDTSVSTEDWAVFDFNFRIIGPYKKKRIASNSTTKLDAITIVTPKNFEAYVTAITGGDVSNNKSVASTTTYGNSVAIWGDVATDNRPFASALFNNKSSSIQALELTLTQDGQELKVTAENPLIIRLNQASDTKSVEDNYTIIPYGYDEATQIYFPIGYRNAKGEIVIEQLPKPSTGRLEQKAIDTKSVWSSVKLYFKKIFRITTETITLHYFEKNKWQISTDKKKIKAYLETQANKTAIPLVIHGIFGDTKSIMESLKQDEQTKKQLPTILSFDYENLENKIEEIAEKLKIRLDEIGIGKQKMPKLNFVAHSMGGLVSRQFVKEYYAKGMMAKLIMVGTPNGGSEWGKSALQLAKGAKGLLTHAMNVGGPLKWVISGVSFLIENCYNPGNTLKQMSLNSDFLSNLNKQPLPKELPYFIVGSDTALIKEGKTKDAFLKKVPEFLKQKILFPGLDMLLFDGKPNDMAVTIDSMKALKEADVNSKIAIYPGDHISYFSEETTRKEIINLLLKP